MSESQQILKKLMKTDDLRLRMPLLKSRLKASGHNFLSQRYLANRLERSETSISRALNNDPALSEVRERIVTHLDWIERTYLQKKVA